MAFTEPIAANLINATENHLKISAENCIKMGQIWKVQMEIILHPHVNHFFHYTEFHEYRIYTVKFNRLHPDQIVSKWDGKCGGGGEKTHLHP
jgi:hypothetical protein